MEEMDEVCQKRGRKGRGYRWMGGWVGRWIGVFMEGRTDERTDGRIDGWTKAL